MRLVSMAAVRWRRRNHNALTLALPLGLLLALDGALLLFHVRDGVVIIDKAEWEFLFSSLFGRAFRNHAEAQRRAHLRHAAVRREDQRL